MRLRRNGSLFGKGVGTVAANYWIGVDLGGTKILAGVFDDQFKLLARAKLSTPEEAAAAAVFARIDQVGGQITGMGLGVPGQVDPRTRQVRYAHNLGWKNLDLATCVPPSWTWPCFVENDVKLGTY